MIARLLISVLLVSSLLGGCRKNSALTAQPEVSAPEATTVVSDADVKRGFGSPEALTWLLERRWPLAAIRAYCTPERRHNDAYQNLVPDSKVVWEGALYRDIATGFDKIVWYATTTDDGRVKKFSLGAYRGKDYWLLEIGSEASVRTAPDYSPDPNDPRFVGHKR